MVKITSKDIVVIFTLNKLISPKLESIPILLFCEQEHGYLFGCLLFVIS